MVKCKPATVERREWMKYVAGIMIFLFMLVGVVEASSDIDITVNGQVLEQASALTKVIDQSVYVPLRSIAESLGAEVDWLPEDQAVEVTNATQHVRLWLGLEQATVNGEVVKLEKVPFAEAGRTFVPIRFLSESLGMNVNWVQATRSVTIASSVEAMAPKAVINYSAEDKKWLALIIEAEAGGEPLEGKIAVGAVIINRVQSDLFPNTITDVIFEKSYGYYQYTPVETKYIYKVEPSKETYEAVDRALSGEDPSEGALYFFNPKHTTSQWLKSRKVIKDIGAHRFTL